MNLKKRQHGPPDRSVEEKITPCKRIKYADPKERKECINRSIDGLKEESGECWKVVAHSLFIYSGDVEKARTYLQAKGGESDFFLMPTVLDLEQLADSPWFPEEDHTLLSNRQARIACIIKERGNQETLERINFLCCWREASRHLSQAYTQTRSQDT